MGREDETREQAPIVPLRDPDHARRVRMMRERERVLRLTPEIMERIGIPRELWRIGVETAPPSVRRPLERYLEQIEQMLDEGVGLYITGERGVGKSGFAAIIARRARGLKRSVLWLSGWELRESRRDIRRRYDADHTVTERALRVDLLVIDNVTAEDLADRYYGAAEFVALCAQRSGAGKATFLTTSIRDDVLSTQLVDAVDRMLPLEVKGANLRREKTHKLLNRLK